MNKKARTIFEFDEIDLIELKKKAAEERTSMKSIVVKLVKEYLYGK